MAPPQEVHPIRRLWRHAPKYRGRIVRGSVLTALNKLFDIAPELQGDSPTRLAAPDGRRLRLT